MMCIKNIVIKFINDKILNFKQKILKIEDCKYEDLAPKDYLSDEKQREYINAIKWAVDNKNITNFAISGPYGAGKSTIIKIFQNENECKYKFLNISLASFSDKKNKKNEDEDQITSKKNEDQDQLDGSITTNEKISLEDNHDKQELIEKSILQQMFYREKWKTLKHSRFRRIKNTKSITSFINISIFLILIASIVLLLKPGILDKSYLKHLTPNGDLLILIVMVLIPIFIFQLSSYFSYFKFKKLVFNDVEVDISDDKDVSILNKHIDEILYFFEVAKYNIVIFEDLDRFKNPDIFRKLREINKLLNDSKQIKNKPVTFLYAIKDNMFNNEDRTKFFEFIIPIVPIINSSNSQATLLKKLDLYINKDDDKDSNKLDEKVLKKISLYIDDMRLLINISNEFKLYHSQISKNEDEHINLNKLLSMIVFKNKYPDDYAELQKDKGIVYEIFNEKKKQLIQTILDNNQIKIDEQKDKITVSKAEHLNNMTELRILYLFKLHEMCNKSISTIRVDGKEININELYDNDELFIQLFKEKNIIVNGSFTSLTLTQVEAKLDNKLTYIERSNNIKNKQKNEFRQINNEINILENTNKYISSKTFQELLEMKDINDSPIFQDEKIKNNLLLKYLIRDGLINEKYHTYTSYFYEGSITQKDKNFLLSVEDRRKPDFDYKLDNIENIVDELSTNDFTRLSILNYDIVDYVLINKSEYFEEIIKQIKSDNETILDFINKYIFITIRKKELIQSISKNIPDFFELVVSKPLFAANIENIFTLLLEYSDTNDLKMMNKNDILKNYIENKNDFLNLRGKDNKPLYENQIKLIETIRPHFNSLDKLIYPEKDVLEYIVKNNLYVINQNMIELIINELNTDTSFFYSLRHSNYTAIINSSCNELKQYISQNLEQYLQNVFLTIDTNRLELIDTILILLDNEELDLTIKEQIIGKQKIVIDDILKVKDTNCWTKFFDVSKVLSNWDNVIRYFQKNGMDSTLIKYLNIKENTYELTKKLVNIYGDNYEADITNQFFTKVVESDDFKNEIFTFIINASRAFKYSINDIIVPNDKMYHLIFKQKLEETYIKNYEFLKENYDDLHLIFLENNIEEYIKEQYEYEITSDDLKYLLESNIINNKDKIKILLNIHPDLIDSEDIAKLVYNFREKTNFDMNMILALIKHLPNDEYTVNLLLSHMDILSNDQIGTILNSMSIEYAKITNFNNRQITLKENYYNRRLIISLQEKDILGEDIPSKNETVRVYIKKADI